MLRLELSQRFKKSLKKYKNQKKVLEELDFVLEQRINNKPLPQKYKDHELKGNFRNIRECHLKPDALLLYFVVDNEVLKLYNIGSHSGILRL